MIFSSFFQKKNNSTTPLEPIAVEGSSAVQGHLAIIMDGNGRWAQKKGLPRSYGHRVGSENLKRITEACCQLGIRYLTVYAFSTENWKRPHEEVSTLLNLFIEFFQHYDRELEEQDIRLRFMGRRVVLPQDVQETMREAEDRSALRQRMDLIIAFNYGGRAELVEACQKLIDQEKKGSLAGPITEELLSSALYLPDVPDPFLLIRSGGEQRLSNFLLWQMAYTEFYVTDVLWPDFSPQDLQKAIDAFHQRKRRFGGLG